MNDTPYLNVEGLNVYYGSSHILHDLSVRIEHGEILGVLGRNGAGKTTLIKSLMGFTMIKSGDVTYQGDDITSLKPYERRHLGLSWIPEDRRVIPHLTVEENLRIMNYVGGTREQLDEVYRKFPRLEERKTQKAGTLSGGEQQMLAIGRALIGPTTDLLLLDEPTEGLAPAIVDNLKSLLLELRDEGVTILLVEQNSEMALDVIDRVYFLEKGVIQYEGQTEDVRSDPNILLRYLGVQ